MDGVGAAVGAGSEVVGDAVSDGGAELHAPTVMSAANRTAPLPNRIASASLRALWQGADRRARYSIRRVQIDLNADVGESYGAWAMGQDEELVPLMTSVNIACGAHAGDPLVMARTVELAREHGVSVGAHPGYPDRDGFGRRDMTLAADELEASLLYQLGALSAFVRDAGVELRHVKPHGALYNRAARDPDVAAAVARAVRRFDASLVLIGLAGSRLLDAGRVEGLAVRGEAFADRAYEPDGTLRSRIHPDAVLPDPEAAAEQAVSIVVLGKVVAVDGSAVPVAADTLCIHGDTPGAPEYARRVRAELDAAGVTVAPLPRPTRRRRG
jgi:5-oxoprolinase (ATP-hydrolysing) subunit A